MIKPEIFNARVKYRQKAIWVVERFNVIIQVDFWDSDHGIWEACFFTDNTIVNSDFANWCGESLEND